MADKHTKLVSVTALIRKREYAVIHAINKNSTSKMTGFSIRIILNSISGMYRSLFHPLATVRHRM
jgi:hypothetical protein